MSTPRKHTKAIKYIIDDNAPASDLDNAPQEAIDQYLQSKGVNIPNLNTRIDKFAETLRGKLKLQCAAKERATKTSETKREADLSLLSDEELLARLIRIHGSIEDLPFAARTTKGFKRQELESLYRDSLDE
jgi:GTP-binding protein EngB required for normal cell division